MNISNNVKNFLYDKDYYILIFENSLYLYGQNKIIYMDDYNIKIELNNILFDVYGEGLKIKKSFENEMLITGIINEIKR